MKQVFETVTDARNAGIALIGKFAKCELLPENNFGGSQIFKFFKITKYAVDTDSGAVKLLIELDDNFFVDVNTLFEIKEN